MHPTPHNAATARDAGPSTHPPKAAGIRLVCGCCAHVEEFASYDEAFDTGWDTPDRFGYTACQLCPGVCVYFPLFYASGIRATADRVKREELQANAAHWSHFHDQAHDRWKREERPVNFGRAVELGDIPEITLQ
jgi:hypothetical protein